MIRRRRDGRKLLGIRRERVGLVDADVFVPDGGIFADVSGQQIDAIGGMQVDDVDAIFAKPVDAASEVDRFSDDYGRNAELADKPAAIPTRRQCGDHDLVAIGALAPCAAEGVGFTVDARVVLLNPSIVTSAQEASLGVKKSSADRNAAFGEALARFVQGDTQHLLEVR